MNRIRPNELAQARRFVESPIEAPSSDELHDSIAWEAFEAGFAAGRHISAISVRERFERWWREAAA